MIINLVLLCASGLSLAIVLLIAKYAVASGMHPLHYAFFQALGGFMFILSFNISKNHELKARDLKDYFPYFSIAALLGISLPQVLAFYAVVHVGVGIVSLSYCLPIVVTYLIAICIKVDKYDPVKLAFLSLTVFGTFIYLFKPEYFVDSLTPDFWYLLLLLIPLSVGFANIYRTLNWPSKLSVTSIAMWVNFSATLIFALVVAVFASDFSYFSGLSLGLYGLIFVQMLFSGISQVLAFMLQEREGAIFISQTGSVVTVLGGALGFIVFSESYKLNSFVGSVFILVGVYLYSRRKSRDFPT